MEEQTTFDILREGSIASIVFSRSHKHNPFSTERQIELTKKINDLNNDLETAVIILYGGEGRSFSVGGDFNEVVNFIGKNETDFWLESTLNLYLSILESPKPVIAAIDGYAIGFGLQVALCCDYRIGSNKCILMMPELKKNLSCINGMFMLEKVIGRANMQALVWECGEWKAEKAINTGLIHRVVESDHLLEESINFAKELSRYGITAMCLSKQISNKLFADYLKDLLQDAKKCHRETFSEGIAQTHMMKIISREK